MIQQTIAHTHEIFSRDDTVEVLPRIYKGDVGATVISVDFMRDGKALDLSEYAVCVTNSAPNHDVLNIIGGNEAPLVVDGNRITWTLREFDTAQVGTYLAQLKVATGEQQLTVVFIRYNVERGVDGNIVTAPVQYTSFTALVKLVEDRRRHAVIIIIYYYAS